MVMPFGVSSNEAGWQAAIHAVVHRIGRHFGFQAFNQDPRTQQTSGEPAWTPATIFLVTDHLYHLLVKNYMRRDTAAGTDDDRFGRAVFRLHDAIFTGYRDWCAHVNLPPRVKELELETLQKYGAVVEWEYLLEELSLYFLIYSEGANLRHTPEALWFVFWLLRNSRDKINQITSPPPNDPRSAAFASHSEVMRGLMKKRCHLRNKYHSQIKQWRAECGIKGDGDHVSTADLVKAHAHARRQIVAAGFFTSAEAVEIDLLAEMVAYGDSGPFLDRVVTPIFGFLAIQVDKMGTSAREIAHRVTYDDCNESLCSKEVVHKVLGLLGVKMEPRTGRLVLQGDPYDALLAVGQVSLNVAGGPNGAGGSFTGSVGAPASRGSSASGANGVEKRMPGDSFAVQLGWDWKAAREWWARFVFGKTYVERRSILTMYRTFFRVWTFYILEFQVMAVLLWGWGDFYALTSVCLTHSALCLLEQIAGAWTQRAPAKGVRVWGNPFWGRFSKGIVDWMAINAVMWLALVAQLTEFFGSLKVWWFVAAGYTALVVVHAVLSTRDGYCISMSNSVGVTLRRWAKNSCCGWFWRLLAWFFARVGASSARPPPKLYLAPYEMKVGWDTFFSNVLFWVIALAMKFAFDWFAVMKSLEAPVLGLWNRGWLSSGEGNIYINGSDTGIPKPDGDVILCIARCLPGFIVMFNDLQIFYYVTMAVFGCFKGLVQLNLGNISSFQDLVVTFHKAPFRWWEAGVSEKGAANILRAIDSAAHAPSGGGGPSVLPPSLRNSGDQTLTDMMKQRALDRQKLSYTERLIQTTQDIARHNALSESKQVRSYFSDENISRWLVFSDVWNAVVEELRQVDLISDSEKDNLIFVHLDIDRTIEIVEDMRPFMLPIFFYGGQINRALEVPGVDSGQHVALTEIRALLVWLLLQLGIVNKEQADAMLHFTPLERPTTLDHRTKRAAGVTEVVKFLKGLQAVQARTPDEGARRNRWATAQGLHEILNKLCDILTVEIKAVVEEFPWGPNSSTDVNPGRVMNGRAVLLKEVLDDLKSEVLDPWQWSAFIGEQGGLSAIYYEADDSASKKCIAKVVRHVLKMLETSAKGAQPRGEEAQRILSVFMSSLKNPTLNVPPSIDEMLSFNTLTPHYEEDVIYALNSANVAKHFSLDATAARGLSDLVRENEDGISVMQWLKSAYSRDWQNLMERLKPKLNGLDPRHITEDDFDVGGPLHHAQMELLLWASYRGQLLARTVRGMMAYENALRLLAHLENPKPSDMSDVKYEALVEDLVRSKFTYVVASQVYATNRASNTARGRWLARGVDLLLHQYPGLRVAYIDTQFAETGSQQFSVLIRGRIGIPATDANCTEELYRIRLPQNRETSHGVILGEGKPENQNAAIIFCFGEIVQAIDMNQDNYLCEALKMRNLVSEFNPPLYDNQAAVGDAFVKAKDVPLALKPGQQIDVHATVTRLGGADAGHVEQPWPDMRHGPVCLVGFREWVFSGDSGALASFAAATEFTFGSMVQRVMCWPGAVRFHYGHPDLWNKLFVMSRGGVSKATRAFHISEDVFAGYNHTLRGGKTKFKEYISVGKGRDMGFDSINSFESKVAGGNGEQVMSRDVHRLGTQFDFFRLLSFYQSGPGFYINTYLVMLSVYANVWVLLLLALTDSQSVVDPRTDEVVSAVTGQADTVSAQQIVQLGMFSIVTYAVELTLEYGIVNSISTILVQLLQGSIAFYIFRSRTSAYYFKQDVQYGGAKYIPTGRGYAIKHNSFVKVYTTYARSHLYYAVELVVMLVLLALVGSESYGVITWSTWLVSVSILWAPFWFNPQTFQLERCKDDFEGWMMWMSDVTDTETGTTWYSWNKAQLEKPRNENQSQTNPFATAFRGVFSSLPTAILGVAAITSLEDTRWNQWIVFGVATGGFWFMVVVVMLLRRYLLSRYRYRIWRLIRTLLLVMILGFVVVCIIFIPSAVSAGVGFKNIFLLIFANFEMVVVATQLLMYTRRGSLKARYLVDSAYRVMDWFIGYLLFFVLFILSFLQVFDLVQGALLFNMKFSKTLQRARLLEANFLTSYVDRAMERVGKQVKEETLKQSGPGPSSTATSSATTPRLPQTTAVPRPLEVSPQQPKKQA